MGFWHHGFGYKMPRKNYYSAGSSTGTTFGIPNATACPRMSRFLYNKIPNTTTPKTNSDFNPPIKNPYTIGRGPEPWPETIWSTPFTHRDWMNTNWQLSQSLVSHIFRGNMPKQLGCSNFYQIPRKWTGIQNLYAHFCSYLQFHA